MTTAKAADEIIVALIELGGTADYPTLRKRSGWKNITKILGRLPAELKRFVQRPGRGRSDYTTTIKFA